MELPRIARRPAPSWLLVLAAASAAAALISIAWFDQPIARAIAPYESAATWNRGIEALEWIVGLPLFRWASSVVLVAGMIITVCMPRWRVRAPAWMFVAATHLVAQVAMRYIKDWTGRLRPLEWLDNGGGETFGWQQGASFPSGHVVIFASLAIPFVALFPRWWPVLGAIVFVMAARVAASAHFVSDVLGAITLVCLVAWAFGWVIRPRRD